MATLSAKKITEALKKAQNVGQAEEPVNINGCEIVLRSLRPDEYEAVSTDIDEIPEGIGYLNAFKREHIARSVVEVNGIDLRNVDFVEVDVEDLDERTKKTVVKEVKVERHAFVRDYVIATWSREAIDVLFRKFNEVVAKAEKLAAEGVTFSVPDETEEEKYRRLLTEAKEVEGSVPVEVSARVREELGFSVKTQPEEYKAAADKLSKLASEQEEEAAPQEPVPAPQAQAPRTARAVVPKAAQAPVEAQEEVPLARPAVPIPGYVPPSPEELMAGRQPLNQRAVPVPMPQQHVGQPPPNLQANPVIPPPQAALRKAAEIAALEGDVGAGPVAAVQGGTQFGGVVPPGTPTELSRPQLKVDPKAAEQIFEQPPVAGINPRFRPPTRL